jgi:integrase/recombinase XerD
LLVINIEIPNEATKGNSGGIVYLAPDLLKALGDLRERESAGDYVISTERADKASAQVIVNMFQGWYASLGYDGCNSHSGRRTFITDAARKIGSVVSTTNAMLILN